MRRARVGIHRKRRPQQAAGTHLRTRTTSPGIPRPQVCLAALERVRDLHVERQRQVSNPEEQVTGLAADHRISAKALHTSSPRPAGESRTLLGAAPPADPRPAASERQPPLMDAATTLVVPNSADIGTTGCAWAGEIARWRWWRIFPACQLAFRSAVSAACPGTACAIEGGCKPRRDRGVARPPVAGAFLARTCPSARLGCCRCSGGSDQKAPLAPAIVPLLWSSPAKSESIRWDTLGFRVPLRCAVQAPGQGNTASLRRGRRASEERCCSW